MADISISGNPIWSTVVVPSDGKIASQATLAAPLQALADRSVYNLQKINNISATMPYLVYRPGGYDLGCTVNTTGPTTLQTAQYQITNATDPNILVGDILEISGFIQFSATPDARLYVSVIASPTINPVNSAVIVDTTVIGSLSPWVKIPILESITVNQNGSFSPFLCVSIVAIGSGPTFTFPLDQAHCSLTYKFYHS